MTDYEYDVFLSHSSKDKPAVSQLAERLRDDGLEVWLDQWIIQPGDHWPSTIETGLQSSRVLVLVMSENTFGSEWVTLERWTVLFRNPLNSERRFIPLLLSDCTIPDVLSAYQYIDFREESETAYQQLLDSCQPRIPWSNKTMDKPKRSQGARPELMLMLDINNDNQLIRKYCYSRTYEPAPVDWSLFDSTFSKWINPAERSQCHDDKLFLKSLFILLFGDPDDSKTAQLMSRILELEEDEFSSAVDYPIRLRIYSKNTFLLNLPWHLTHWREDRLVEHNWTFELTPFSPDKPAKQWTLQLKSPYRILFIAPDSEDKAPYRSAHHDDLLDKLRNTWAVSIDCLQTAGDWKSVRSCMRQPVRLIYYYGLAKPFDDDIWLMLEDNDKPEKNQSLSVLLKLLRHQKHPSIVFLNLLYESDQLPLVGKVLSRLSQCPLLFIQVTERREAIQAQQSFMQWYGGLLAGKDPIQLINQYGQPGALVWNLCDRYEIKGEDTHIGASEELLAHRLLDRIDERQLVNHTVDHIFETTSRRLGCVVAYAESGNRLDLFIDQARDYLARHARDKAMISIRQLRTELDQGYDTCFERAIRQLFGLHDYRIALEKALPRALEKELANRFRASSSAIKARPLLILDWEVWQLNDFQEISKTIEGWIRFCSRYLARTCPGKLRILSCVAIECSEQQYDAVTAAVSKLRRDNQLRKQPSFYLERPAHLQHVSQEELEDFLFEEHVDCPIDSPEELAEIIIEKTGGRYDKILESIHQLQAGSWHTLFEKWRENR